MSERVQATVEDVLTDEHLVQPSFDKQALAAYLVLRQANPHLPDPKYIPAETNLELTWGLNRISTLSLSLVVDLPQSFIEGLPGDDA